LIDVVDLQKIAVFVKDNMVHDWGETQISFAKDKPQLYNNYIDRKLVSKMIIDGKPYLPFIYDNYFLLAFLDLNVFLKLIFYYNTTLSEMFNFPATTLTFWLVPPVSLFIVALVLLFLIKPNELNMKIWLLSKYIVGIILIYQFCNILIYLHFFEEGIVLRVGKPGSFNLPFNINLAKLLATLLIIFSIFITILFYTECYSKTLLSIKPEFCSVLFFLGFGCSMVFFQNDLFSIFLYFEIISFCIYGLLFLHK